MQPCSFFSPPRSKSSAEEVRTKTRSVLYCDNALSLEFKLNNDGNIKEANRFSIRALGYSLEELRKLQGGILALMSTKSQKKFQKELLREKTTAPEFCIIGLQHKNGSVIPVVYNIKYDAAGRNVFFSAIDITHLLNDTSIKFNNVRDIAQQFLGAMETLANDQYDEIKIAEKITECGNGISELTRLFTAPEPAHELRGQHSRPQSQNAMDELKVHGIDDYSDLPALHMDLNLDWSKLKAIGSECEQILGYSEKELIEITATKKDGFAYLIHPDDRSLITKNLESYKSGIAKFSVMRIKHKSKPGYAYLAGCANPNLVSQTVNIVAVDLTPYSTSVHKLMHEVRNIAQQIATVIAEIQEVIADKSKKSTSKQQEILEFARIGKLLVEDLSRSINNQTTLRFFAINPIATDVSLSVETLVRLFQKDAAKKAIDLKVAGILPKQALYLLDRYQVEVIMRNLLTNAIKYTEKGGTIIVTLNIKSKPQCTGVDELQFVVADTGIGIDKKDLPHIFEEYYRTQQAKEGTSKGEGLGLAAVWGLVERMKGKVEVASEFGKGTTMVITIPAKQCIQELKKEPASSSHSVVSSPRPQLQKIPSVLEPKVAGLNVLFVDDSKVNQKFFSKWLEKMGCICKTASNGVEAISELKQAKCDVVFMDINMPGMGGIEATRTIIGQKLAPEAVIIGLSGGDNSQDKAEAIAAGMKDYLVKPVSQSDLKKSMLKNIFGVDEETAPGLPPEETPRALPTSPSMIVEASYFRSHK